MSVFLTKTVSTRIISVVFSVITGLISACLHEIKNNKININIKFFILNIFLGYLFFLKDRWKFYHLPSFPIRFEYSEYFFHTLRLHQNHIMCLLRFDPLFYRRKGNEIAKHFANNKVDVIIYAVEKSLDSYKFNLLYNKQLFINQLKNNSLNKRTIDEGSMDEKSGMNFSEYVAILSGNTDLLEKAKLEKMINGLESEKQSFNRSKMSSKYKFEDLSASLQSSFSRLNRMKSDWENLQSRI